MTKGCQKKKTKDECTLYDLKDDRRNKGWMHFMCIQFIEFQQYWSFSNKVFLKIKSLKKNK